MVNGRVEETNRRLHSAVTELAASARTQIDETNTRLGSAVTETNSKLDTTRTELMSTTQRANDACTKTVCDDICQTVGAFMVYF